MSSTGIPAGIAGLAPGPRLRTLAVVIVTTIAIATAAWMINSPASDGLTEIDIASGPGDPPAAGAAPPDFTAQTVDGATFTLGDYAGKPVWLTFGASWCGDCRAEAPDLEATYAAYKDRGLVVVGVFIQEDAAAVREYAGRVGFSFTMTADPNARIAAAYHTLGIPTHFFIDRDGLVRQVRLGALERDDMERLVLELLG